MAQTVQIDFGTLASLIAEEARNPYEPEDVERRVGLSFVLELKEKPADSRGFWAQSGLSAHSMVQTVLLNTIFAGRFTFFAGPGTLPPGQLQLQTLAVSELVRQRPDLGRFLTMRIAGVKFETLNALLASHYPRLNLNAYDFAYDLAVRLNTELDGRGGPVSVSRASPDIPFHFSCHQEPPDRPGLWPHDQQHMDIYTAWRQPAPAGGKKYGEGIRVGHLDTGWSVHQAYAKIGTRLLYGEQYNAETSDNNAKDPLETSPFNKEPGHGTTTATIIVSGTNGDPPDAFDDSSGVLGVATRAEIVPILVCTSTAFVYNSFVARGLSQAIVANCHVVSISIGGLLVHGFKDIAAEANARNMLIVAAAGNCVWPVVYPARFSECLAVGGSTIDDKYWVHAPDDFCVDLAAPCDGVRTTHIDNTMSGPVYPYNNGSGTSYSTAYMAGVAALWRGFFFGSSAISSSTPLQSRFAKSAKTHVDVPSSWDSWFHGTGISNARKLLTNAPATVDLRPTDRLLALAQAEAPELNPAGASGGIPSMPAPAIDDAKLRLEELTELLYQSVTSQTKAAMLTTAQGWFAGPSPAVTLTDLDLFGCEMVNLFLAAGIKDDQGKPDSRYKTTHTRLAWAFEIYKSSGSNALRGALRS
jgi:hypothetical protein